MTKVSYDGYMPFDFFEGRLTPDHQKIDPVYLAPRLEEMTDGSFGYITVQSYWVDREGFLWVEADTPVMHDAETFALADDDEFVRVIKTPAGYVLDMSHMNLGVNGTEMHKIARQPALDTNVEVVPVPVVDWISSPEELQLAAGILRTQFSIELPESLLERVDEMGF